MNLPVPPSAVVRISRASFDPSRYDDAVRMLDDTSKYLRPAIGRLPGLIGYYAGASPDGSMVAVSLWDSDEHAQQMGTLKEMIIDARRDAAAAGVEVPTIVNYPIVWQIQDGSAG